MRLSAEHPRDALARDEALLGQVQPAGPALVRWYVATSPAVVIGLGLRHRIAELLDQDRCRAGNVSVLDRSAGGGLVLVDEHMLCCAICLPVPHPLVSADLTESYHWLGDRLAGQLRATLGVLSARSVTVAEARADVAALRAADDPVSRLLLTICYGALSPHEVVAGHNAKVVGLAQVRRRHAALFQIGILLRDQSRLADLVRVPDEPTRERLRTELRRRSVGLNDVLERPPDLEALVRDLQQPLLLLQADQFA